MYTNKQSSQNVFLYRHINIYKLTFHINIHIKKRSLSWYTANKPERWSSVVLSISTTPDC